MLYGLLEIQPFIQNDENIVILCSTININKNLLVILVKNWLLLVHFLKTILITLINLFENHFNYPNRFIYRLLPHDGCFSINRMIINEIKSFLSLKYSVNNFHFINQNNVHPLF